MSTATAQQLRHIVHLRFELPGTVQLEDLRPLLEQVTPQVQLLDPDTSSTSPAPCASGTVTPPRSPA
ncbi:MULTISPECIES: hypothetical protein [unclassified Streptomyces]|uniref:hypothetical protein n=1 Tax=unclassified Streptomyces TaxID=2593676 RepID=UPI00085171BD|nr:MULTISPECIES: hypothetical protein [unclassified Streptomyces]MDX3488215.1 hypothetical protein [Streptomyces sp. ID05-18]